MNNVVAFWSLGYCIKSEFAALAVGGGEVEAILHVQGQSTDSACSNNLGRPVVTTIMKLHRNVLFTCQEKLTSIRTVTPMG